MRLGTRLLLTLLPTTIVVMTVSAGWVLFDRERTLGAEARREIQAYSTALGSAFNLALRDDQHEEAQSLINRLSRDPKVYGILLYDSAGARAIVSDPLSTPTPAPAEVLARVLSTGTVTTLERVIEDQRVLSVFQVLRDPGGRATGVLEVAQPLSADDEKADIRRQFVANTLILLVAITAITLWLIQRVVTDPMERLLTAVRALGKGELGHRVPEGGRGGEIAALADEFNTMAGNLEQTRAAFVREAEERVALERRLRESEKMAAIGNLAAGLAHEIAAPLNVISGRAEQMLRREQDGETRQRNLSIIVGQIRRITTIVRNLLDFAKKRDAHPRPVPLGEATDLALELLEGELARAEISVAVEGRRDVAALIDPDLLHQMLVNLILNAIQAMEATDRARRLIIRLGERTVGDARQVTIEIDDNGPGLSQEVLASLFRPFFTTKPRGTGLGLAVTRRLADEAGGRLEAENTAEGARFRVLLPLAAAVEATA